MIKIKVSYEQVSDLDMILELLGHRVKSWKVAKDPKGPYKRAYIILE